MVYNLPFIDVIDGLSDNEEDVTKLIYFLDKTATKFCDRVWA